MLQLSESFHHIREHGHRYTRAAGTARLRAAWHDSALRSRLHVPILQLYAAYGAAVGGERLSAAERRACRRTLMRWWFVNWNSARVAADLASLMLPGLVGFAERTKSRLFGRSVGHLATPRKTNPQTGSRVDSVDHPARNRTRRAGDAR